MRTNRYSDIGLILPCLAQDARYKIRERNGSSRVLGYRSIGGHKQIVFRKRRPNVRQNPNLALHFSLPSAVENPGCSISPKDYLAAWHDWQRGCSELQELQMWVGEARASIEEVSSESDWTIEWRNINEEVVRL